MQSLKKYLSIFLGMSILSFGLFNIHSRTAISEGGILGMTLLLKQWFDISPSISGVVMDVSCFVLGTCVLGKDFLRDSVIASLSFSFFYRLNEWIGPLLPDLSRSPLWAALLGGLFVGIGVGLSVSQNVAAGGDDALALVIQKKLGLPIFWCYFFSDFTVLLLSLSYIPWQRIMYSLITVFISSQIIQFINVHCSTHTEEVAKES